MNAPLPLPEWVRRSAVQELIAEHVEAETRRCTAIAQRWLNAAKTPPGRKVARGILRQIEDGDPGF